MRDHRFVIDTHQADDGWRWTITGNEPVASYGPHETHAAMLEAQQAVFARWKRRAKERGGWPWRKTGSEWVMTLPDEVEAGGLPLGHAPESRPPRRDGAVGGG